MKFMNLYFILSICKLEIAAIKPQALIAHICLFFFFGFCDRAVKKGWRLKMLKVQVSASEGESWERSSGKLGNDTLPAPSFGEICWSVMEIMM